MVQRCFGLGSNPESFIIRQLAEESSSEFATFDLRATAIAGGTL